jgi:hypothetical protein
MTISLRARPDPRPRLVPLVRGPSRAPAAGRSIRLAALRVPLVVKLVGANLVVVALLLGAWLLAGGPFNTGVAAGVSLVIAVHLALVFVALRPIRDLESAAARVWRGDYGARVQKSSVADH